MGALLIQLITSNWKTALIGTAFAALGITAGVQHLRIGSLTDDLAVKAAQAQEWQQKATDALAIADQQTAQIHAISSAAIATQADLQVKLDKANDAAEQARIDAINAWQPPRIVTVTKCTPQQAQDYADTVQMLRDYRSETK